MQKINSGSLTAYDHVLTSKIMSRHKQWSLYQIGLVVLDALCVAVALVLAYKVRIDGWLFGWAYDNPIDQAAYNTVVAISVPIWLAWMAMLGMYMRDNLLGGMTEYKGVVKASSAGVFTIIFFSFLLRESNMDLSRWWIVLAWVFSIGCLITARFFARRLVYFLWSRPDGEECIGELVRSLKRRENAVEVLARLVEGSLEDQLQAFYRDLASSNEG